MENENIQNEEMHLDDAARVRVLSPGMMVLKRFIRNQRAIVGIAIIALPSGIMTAGYMEELRRRQEQEMAAEQQDAASDA